MKALTYDREMEVRHDNGKLVASGTKHVDDIKYGAEPHILWKEIVPALEEVFGKLKINKKTFTNTGVRHSRQDDGTIVTDQDEYILALKTITTPKMIGKPAEDDADDELTALFWSLLGAVAYAIYTILASCLCCKFAMQHLQAQDLALAATQCTSPCGTEASSQTDVSGYDAHRTT